MVKSNQDEEFFYKIFNKENVMDIGKAFTYIFKDEDWIKKVLIGGLLLLIPIFGWAFAIGYFFVHYNHLKADDFERPLPEWDKLGDMFIIGLKFIVIYIVYFIPIFFLEMVLTLIPILGFSNKAGEKVGIFIAFIGFLFYFLAILYGFFVALITPGIIIEYVREYKISDGFKISEIFSMLKKNFLDFFIIFLLLFVCKLIASVGVILCCIGYVFTTFIAIGIYFKLVSQLDLKIEKNKF